MEIRLFMEKDIQPIVSLFYETVHTINKRDYSQEQLNAWASRDEEDQRLQAWNVSLVQNITYVAEISGQIVGFSDLTQAGHLERLFVHKDFQGIGIASALVHKLECEARKLELSEMSTEASLTARSFFERLGFTVIQSQIVERKGVGLVNFKMSKHL